MITKEIADCFKNDIREASIVFVQLIAEKAQDLIIEGKSLEEIDDILRPYFEQFKEVIEKAKETK